MIGPAPQSLPRHFRTGVFFASRFLDAGALLSLSGAEPRILAFCCRPVYVAAARHAMAVVLVGEGGGT